MHAIRPERHRETLRAFFPPKRAVFALSRDIVVVVGRTVALFRQPPLSSVHNILSLPFTSEVWSVILVTVVVFVITLVVFTRAADCARVHGAPPSVQDVITLVHGAVCQQGKPN